MTLLQAVGVISVQIVAGIAHTTFFEHFWIKSLTLFTVTGVICVVGAGLLALRLL